MFLLENLQCILTSNEAYAVLDSTQAKGCTWTAGGCALLALALRALLPSAQFYRLGSNKNPVDHVLLPLPDRTFADGDGVSTENELHRRWTDIEGFKRLIIAPMHWWTVPTEIPHRAEDVLAVRRFLKSHLTGANRSNLD